MLLELYKKKYSNKVGTLSTKLFYHRTQNAFICNYREHWLTIRKLGNQWFNLNSLLTGPELISDTFLGMLLTQLEGVSSMMIKCCTFARNQNCKIR
jgi:hypothetical protein